MIRSLSPWGACALALLAGIGLAASAQAAGYRAPRTPWGAPNLQGLWSNFALTRLERPPGIPAKVSKGDDVAAIERTVYDHILPADPLGSRESELWEPSHLAVIDGQMRTSWIVSTADGRIPYTPEGRRRLEAWRAEAFTNFDGPEVRNASERCLTPSFSAASPPMQNAPYAANYQIVQTREAVVIVSEIDNEVRIVRLGGPHLAHRVWGGDSVGHWERDTLVVETVGIRPGETFRAPIYYIGPDARVTERFTRVSPTEIRYAFTVEDPASYTEAWRGEMPFRASKGPIYEYACHEGNYSLAGMLEGARYQDAHARPAADH
ncbi:MAG TPA: hypothetical protein VFE10_18485 [Phenylobacterium sp.]|nr:hypothetical protein [Phenylobacterium sp.]